MKSRARKRIEKWFQVDEKGVRTKAKPFYVAPGHVTIFPSSSGESTHHVTCRTERRTPSGRIIIEWVCSCRGWFNNEEDNCWHVRELQDQYEKGLRKLEAS